MERKEIKKGRHSDLITEAVTSSESRKRNLISTALLPSWKSKLQYPESLKQQGNFGE